MSAENIIRDLLCELGIADHLLGYDYISRAIMLVIGDKECMRKKCSKLYPSIASEFNTTPRCVERAIRNAIDRAWTFGDAELQYKYFGGIIRADKYKPTNGEFIARVVNIARMRLSG